MRRDPHPRQQPSCSPRPKGPAWFCPEFGDCPHLPEPSPRSITPDSSCAGNLSRFTSQRSKHRFVAAGHDGEQMLDLMLQCSMSTSITHDRGRAAEVPVKRDLVADSRLDLVDPRVGDMRKHLALQVLGAMLSFNGRSQCRASPNGLRLSASRQISAVLVALAQGAENGF